MVSSPQVVNNPAFCEKYLCDLEVYDGSSFRKTLLKTKKDLGHNFEKKYPYKQLTTCKPESEKNYLNKAKCNQYYNKTKKTHNNTKKANESDKSFESAKSFESDYSFESAQSFESDITYDSYKSPKNAYSAYSLNEEHIEKQIKAYKGFIHEILKYIKQVEDENTKLVNKLSEQKVLAQKMKTKREIEANYKKIAD